MSMEDSSPRSPAANAVARPRRIWTPAEDAILKALVAHYGDARGPQGRWKDIAAGLQDRTAKVGAVFKSVCIHRLEAYPAEGLSQALVSFTGPLA